MPTTSSMNMNIKVLPWKRGSRSARALAESLNCYRIGVTSSYIHRATPKTIINWGNSGSNPDRFPDQGLGDQHTVLNEPDAVRNAACKLTTLEMLSQEGVRVPDYTEDREEALEWLSGGSIVVARSTLNGNSGSGLTIHEPSDNPSIPETCPLYTKYIPKEHEYRVHVVRVGNEYKILDVQRKARRREVPDDEVNWQVRNLEGGFVFTREGVNPNSDVVRQSRQAVRALDLDFGAVDVVWNNRRGEAYVLEVNTAPGLEGTTLERYTEYFNSVLEGTVWEEWTPRMTVTAEADSATEGPSQDLIPPEHMVHPRISELSRGDTVYMDPNSEYLSQAGPYMRGEVGGYGDDPREWIEVRWVNGHVNAYRIIDLLVRDNSLPPPAQHTPSTWVRATETDLAIGTLVRMAPGHRFSDQTSSWNIGTVTGPRYGRDGWFDVQWSGDDVARFHYQPEHLLVQSSEEEEFEITSEESSTPSEQFTTSSEESSTSGELSQESVVQEDTQSEYTQQEDTESVTDEVYGIFYGTVLIADQGVFRTRESAQERVQGDFMLQNMQTEVRPLGLQ